MTRDPDPTKDPEFQRTLKNLLAAKPKPHSEMKVGKTSKTASRDRGEKGKKEKD
jgi:hypothetical protein